MLEGGKYYKFKVTRKTDLGYMLLGDNNEEVLMFYKEAIKEYEVNDLISAFIYYDKLGRFCATTKEVLATSKKIGLLQVVSVASNGAYLDNLTAKDVLLSSDYLPKDKKYWPEVNDKVFVLLKDKKKSLVAKTIKKSDVTYKVNFIEGENVLVTVEEISDKGLLCYTDDLVPVFIPNIFIRDNYHIGKSFKVHITKIKEDICFASLTENKEKQMLEDEEIILNYLKNNHRQMPFTAKSSSVSIENTFKISRKAFKRAYGKLYKEGKIYFDDTITYLKE